MKVILTKDIHGLGEEGDVVDIANGYARNFLIPTKKVVEYSVQNISVLKSRLKAIRKRKEEKRLQQMSLKERVEGKTFTITINTNDKGHLYGAISQTIVAEALAKEGIEIDKRQLLVPEHTIKSVGMYELVAKFSQDVSAKFSIDIVSENHPELASSVKENADIDVASSTENVASTDTTPSTETETTEIADTQVSSDDSVSKDEA